MDTVNVVKMENLEILINKNKNLLDKVDPRGNIIRSINDIELLKRLVNYELGIMDSVGSISEFDSNSEEFKEAQTLFQIIIRSL